MAFEVGKVLPLCRPSNFMFDGDRLKFKGSGCRETLEVCKGGLEALRAIQDPVITISIAGPARSGKSFFLSQLMEGVNFSVGHKTQSHTTGIWLAISPFVVHRCGMRARILLLDAEGLAAASTEDGTSGPKWDAKIFSICSLISSVLIYNTKEPSSDDVQRLGFISKFSKSIYKNAGDVNPNQQEVYKKSAASFVWLIRDATLAIKEDEDDTSSEEDEEPDWNTYMTENILKLRQVKSQRDNDINDIIKAIRSTYSSFRAVGLPPPSADRKVCRKLNDPKNAEQLKPFLTKVHLEAQNIITGARVKSIAGMPLSGEKLADLLIQYVECVNRGADILPWENIWDAAVKSTLEKILIDAFESFKRFLVSVKMPTDAQNLTKLVAVEICRAERYFNDKTKFISGPIQETYSTRLKKELDEKCSHFMKQNSDISKEFCTDILSKKEFKLREDLGIIMKQSSATYETLLNAKKSVLSEYGSVTNGLPFAEEIKEKGEYQIMKLINYYGKLMLDREKAKLVKEYKQNINQQQLPCSEDNLERIYLNLLQGYGKRILEKAKSCDETSVSELLKELQIQINDVFENVKALNVQKSSEKCENVLKRLSCDFECIFRNIHEIKYDDHILKSLIAAKNETFKKYDSSQSLGPCAGQVREAFHKTMQEKVEIAMHITCERVINKELLLFSRNLQKMSELTVEDDVTLKQNFADCNAIFKATFALTRKRIYEQCASVHNHILDKQLEMFGARCQKSFTDVEKTYVIKYKRKCVGLMQFLMRRHLSSMYDEKDEFGNIDKKKDDIKREYSLIVNGPMAEEVYNDHESKLDQILLSARALRCADRVETGVSALLTAAGLIVPEINIAQFVVKQVSYYTSQRAQKKTASKCKGNESN